MLYEEAAEIVPMLSYDVTTPAGQAEASAASDLDSASEVSLGPPHH